MRIGLSLINFNPGRMGGVESFFWNLLESLQRIDEVNEYVLLCDERSLGYFPLHGKNFSEVLIRTRKPIPFRWLRSLIRRVSGIDLLKYQVDALHLDLVHHPFTIMSPKQSGTPVVLTVHDVQHEFYPEFFGEQGYQKRRAGILASLAGARAVIADSAFTRTSLIEYYGIQPEQATVVHLGKDLRFSRVDDPAFLAEIQQKHDLGRPFLYYPAASWPHKNHAGLLRALKLLIEQHDFNGVLVMSGIAKKAQGNIEGLIDELGLKERVRILGYLESAELPALYSLARMLVYPSFFEGFGLPLLEAMACGCPIACSNTSSLPEVAGDAALLFDPTRPEEIAGAIWAVWSDAGLRDSLLEKARLRVDSFSWESAAQRTIKVYRKALSLPD
jgi:glycosyltransferase involved in cell wall biosynthesis